MTEQIWKYRLDPVDGVQELEMPTDARVLHVDNQHDEITMWALVGSSVGSLWVKRMFEVFGTGHRLFDVPEITRNYLGTTVINPFVWHVFERIAKP